MREAFTYWKPNKATKGLLADAIAVAEEYEGLGYTLTLRQLFYQLVGAELIPNTTRDYKHLGRVVVNARMAGLIDWETIEDRGRRARAPHDYESAAEMLAEAIRDYRLDRWRDQNSRVEIWCEKDALSSVLEPIAYRWHVPYLACRGYASASAVYEAAKRFEAHTRSGIQPVVIYVGDHDPSGLDMTRDLQQRLDQMTWECGVQVRRIALSMRQIQEHALPPNPAKLTDARASDYVEKYGRESWELDALKPQVLSALVEDEILDWLEFDRYMAIQEQESADKDAIWKVAEQIREGTQNDEVDRG